MFVNDKQGSQWALDEGLREMARRLIQKHDDLVGHVNLSQVVFMRFTGSKKANWMGKCFLINKAPQTIIAKYVVSKLAEYGLMDLSQIVGIESDLFDLHYIIAINDDAIGASPAYPDKIEEITLLHELMHISECNEKLVKHNSEDFTEILDKFGVHWVEGIFEEEEAVKAEIKELAESLVAAGASISTGPQKVRRDNKDIPVMPQFNFPAPETMTPEESS